jgi:hypothetical protein
MLPLEPLRHSLQKEKASAAGLKAHQSFVKSFWLN